MRNRVTSKALGDVCFFCSLRWAARDATPTTQHQSLIATRKIHHTRPKNRPAGAAVAQREDDDEEDFPLLRQNAPIAFAPSQPLLPKSAVATSLSAQAGSTPLRTTRGRGRYNSGRFRDAQRSGRIDQDAVRTSQPRHTQQSWRNQQAQDASHMSRGSFDKPRPPFDKDRSKHRQKGPSSPVTQSEDNRPTHYRPSFLAEPTGSAAESTRRNHHPSTMSRDPQSVQKVFNFMPSSLVEPSQQPLESHFTSLEDALIDPIQDHSADQLVEKKQYSRLEERLNQRRDRSTGRFEIEADLPAETRVSYRPSGSSSRGRSGAFDIDFALQDAENTFYGNNKKKSKSKQDNAVLQEPTRTQLVIPDFITVQKLAQIMKIRTDELVQRLEDEGFEGARYDHTLDAETSAMFADIYGFEPAASGVDTTQDLVAQPLPDDMSTFPSRPPIVTIMGHVDHGKTTILDYLRRTAVAAGEHGGITQHIGAFSVTMPGSNRQMTFLDTPGHEAFLDMRRRGANVTDIVVLVVAADDSVKPQTIEAIKHALDAKVQLIVAINKVDKEDANVERVKQDLTRHDIVVEDYGGDFQAVPVSGKTGQGMAELEEAIITLADVLDLRADQDGRMEGSVIESKVTNAGRVATVLVRRGTLQVGDFIVAGPTWGRVRTLRNDQGHLVKIAYPGDPVQVDGWRGSDPTAGLEVIQADNEEHAKDVIDLRHDLAESAQTAANSAAINQMRTQEAEARAKVLAWEAENKVNQKRHENEGWIEKADTSGVKLVPFVIKADVAGSVEALVAAVSAIGNNEIRANVIHSGTGPLVESDVQMLAASDEAGYAISFNQFVDGSILRLAEAAGLGVLDHNIIYKVTDDVKTKVEAELPVVVTQRVLGEAEVGKVFEVTVKKTKVKIAGCKITNGTISRSSKVRVLRNGETIYTGTLDSLKNVKKDVTEMRKGSECGMGFRDWEEFEEGDQIQCFEEKEERRSLY